MSLLLIVGYLAVAIVVYSVLTALADKSGRLTAVVEKGVMILALIWPLWGEIATLAMFGYALIKGLQAFGTGKLQKYKP